MPIPIHTLGIEEADDGHTALPDTEESRSTFLDTLSLSFQISSSLDRTGFMSDFLAPRHLLQGTETNDTMDGIRLLGFATNYAMQFEQSGQVTKLELAISAFRRSLALLPVHHPTQLPVRANLANALIARFSQSGQRQDLDEAISLSQDALKLQAPLHHDRAATLFSLANALYARFEQSGKDLEDIIGMLREALELNPASHSLRSALLTALGGALHALFTQSGQIKDLDDAISISRDAFELLSTHHLDASAPLNNLASHLILRFDMTGQRDDLDEAISLHRNAVELVPLPHIYRSTSLTNLAAALIKRFGNSGQPHDLDEGISFHREALKLRPAPHPNRSSALHNLATGVITRYSQSDKCEDLNEAISLDREALGLRPMPHPERSASLNSLAGALAKLFYQSGDRDSLDESISLQRDALALVPAPHPDRPMFLYNLANRLIIDFPESGRSEDLDEIINKFYECLEGLPSGHPSVCKISVGLGRALYTAYSLTNESETLEKGIDALRVAVTCESAPASDRFSAAKQWAYIADSIHGSALEAYHAAIELLPRLAMLGLDLQSRQQALTSGSDGLARSAAAYAIKLGQYDKAIELLEGGRAVFWSQAVRLRTPMIALHDAAPELEGRFKRISLALEQGSLRDASRNASDNSRRVMSMDKEASHFRRLNAEWLTTLEEVRRLKGFQDFLGPSQLSTLQHAATNGPIVVLNASTNGCAGLILTSTGVQHVPFLDLSFTGVIGLVRLLRHAIAQDGRDALVHQSNRMDVEGLVQQMPFISDTIQLLRLPLERHIGRVSATASQPDNIFRYVLGVLWVSVVEPVIRFLELVKSDRPPNLWWCPTGPFSFLPIHAAGIDLTKTMESVSDYIVSSYTPTISSLLSDIPLPTKSFKMMVVIQSETPGQKPLPGTLVELRKIEAHVPKEGLVKLVPGFVKDVMLNLPATSIAHFACHGQQNTQNPLESALLLQDGQLKVSHIMEQSMPNASLAFLSACETAMGSEDLPDEVIHLAATLLFAGFHGVVATLWSIADPDGPEIVDTFYQNIFKQSNSSLTIHSRPNTTDAAQALHLAVAKLRSKNVSFSRWVPFVHFGR